MESEVSTKKSNKKTFLIIGIIGIIVIGIGLLLSIVFSKKFIIGRGISKISTTVAENLLPNFEETGIKNNFTTTSNVKFNIESEYLELLGAYSPDLQIYTNIVKNLNQTENKITTSQDFDSKKLLVNVDSNYNGQDLLDAKYLVQNNTDYYYVNGLSDNYVKDSSSTYFDSLDEDDTNSKNIKYITDAFIKSLKNNLKDEYFTKTSEKITLDDKEKTYQKYSLVIDEKVFKELGNNIINDLKKDNKANTILNGYDKKFKNYKITNENNPFSNNEKVEFSVYTDSLYFIKRYDLKDTSDNVSISFENGNNKAIKLYSDNKVVGNIKISKSNDTINMDLYSEKESIGTISITNKSNDYTIDTKINYQGFKANLKVASKISNIKKNTSYDSVQSISGSVSSEGTTYANITIDVSSNVKNKATINEDVSNALSSSSITEEKQSLFLNNIITKLTAQTS